MKLKSARITNYRSVTDSGWFQVGELTCLVGKNEAGKSALLTALAALNPHELSQVTLDKERDYPRSRLVSYEKENPDKDALVVDTVWSLDDAEIAVIEEMLGPECLPDKTVRISRRYDQDLAIDLDINFEAAIAHFLEHHEVPRDRWDETPARTSGELKKALEALEDRTPSQEAALLDLRGKGTFTARLEAYIREILPKLLYFSAYDRMDGAVQLEGLKALIANNQIGLPEHSGKVLFTDFLEYAGVSIDELTATKTYESFDAKLQSASNNITDQIQEYWTQNPDLSVNIKVDLGRAGDPAPFNSGTVVRARVHNALHRVDTPFSERSAGFVWFFSFLVKFERLKEAGGATVLLLDEPGLTLHGSAQGELLRFFRDRLQPQHQIIYSTHSPFMVPADDLAGVRTVEDVVVNDRGRRRANGTVVRDDVLATDKDTLFPLQAALGYDVTQSLFIGANTLLVEGPSDILYLSSLSNALKKRGETGLDARWTICPTGGLDKVRSFASLFGGNEINIASLTDFSSSDRKKVDDLRKSKVMEAAQVLTYADFLAQDEADVEDILGPDLFSKILNGAYSLEGKDVVTRQRLVQTEEGAPRLVKQAEAIFRVMPPDVPDFDHATPAFWLLRNSQVLDASDDGVDVALENARKLFAGLNNLLQPGINPIRKDL